MMNLNKIRKPFAIGLVTTTLVLGVKTHEGFVPTAYKPLPEDVPTIGYGSTKHPDGTPVKMGEKITREQAEFYLKNDIQRFVKDMSSCIKVPVSQGEFDAFVSLTYNIGSGAFCKSTLVRKLNKYDYDGACKEILKWSYFKGKQLPGLVKRRNQEYQLCVS